ncbi:AAEL014908-PA [Aedes aegypti]|uniref:AAEL014908-PA n=1 Tax=Aedes aegypti TaxID=7159 RepID=Q16F41_AEDAE|nr:AAEL014908-PA [Aedes aegypti]
MGKKKANQLGRSLIKDRFGQGNRKTVDNNSMLHTTEVQDGYDWGRLNLQSVTEESSFQEFLRTAELAGTEFQAEKLNITYVNPKAKVGLLTTNERVAIERKQVGKKDLLKIPRRPKWTKETTPEELQTMENENFLDWRRGLAALQEEDGMLMTPYERNLDFWRQLWRVVERSDIVVQIVDGRNPLLFRSEDLERYVKEVDERKMNMILINKSDFLNEDQRTAWARYFDEQGIRVAFFSAAESVEEAKREQEEREAREDQSEEDEEDEVNGELDEKLKGLEVKVDQVEKVLEKLEERIEQLTDDGNAVSYFVSHFDLFFTTDRVESWLIAALAALVACFCSWVLISIQTVMMSCILTMMMSISSFVSWSASRLVWTSWVMLTSTATASRFEFI